MVIENSYHYFYTVTDKESENMKTWCVFLDMSAKNVFPPVFLRCTMGYGVTELTIIWKKILVFCIKGTLNCLLAYRNNFKYWDR